ncbi:fucose-binding lectin II [Enterobacteriaceae bacterium LUAb1]
MLNDITDFIKDFNAWTPRLPEYAAPGKANWLIDSQYYSHDFGKKVLIIPTQLVDNKGTVISKPFLTTKGNTYAFTVQLTRLNDVKPFPQISLRTGNSAADSAADKIITPVVTPETGGTILSGSFCADSDNIYLKIYNDVSDGIGNDFAINLIIVSEVDCHCDDNPNNNNNNNNNDPAPYPVTDIPKNTQFTVTLINNEDWVRTAKLTVDGSEFSQIVQGHQSTSKAYTTTTGNVTVAVYDSKEGAMNIEKNVTPLQTGAKGKYVTFGAEKPQNESLPAYMDLFVHITWPTHITN